MARRTGLRIVIAAIVVVASVWLALSFRSRAPAAAAADRARIGASEEHAQLDGPSSASVRRDVEVESSPSEQPVPGARTAAGSTIHALVLDPAGAAVRARVVLVFESSRKLVMSEMAGEDGRATFRDLEAGEYELLVDPRTLPAGYLPPFDQDTTVGYQDSLPPGYFGRSVKVAGNGDEHEVKLGVFRDTVIDGYLLGPHGEPVADAQVRMASRTLGMENLCFDGTTDRDGYFKILGTRAGIYRTQVFTTFEHPYARIAKPLPQEFTLTDGATMTLTLRMPPAAWELRGQVVDQDGKPFPGIDVTVAYARPASEMAPNEQLFRGCSVVAALTDEDGRYAFPHMPSHRVRVRFGLNAYIGSNSTHDWLARLPKPIEIDGRSRRGTFDAGVTLAERTRRFHLSGRVQIDPEWERDNGVRSRDIDVSVETVVDGTPRTKELDLDKAREFAWKCETPAPPFVLHVAVRNRRTTLVERRVTVTPEPLGSHDETIHVP